MATYTLTLAGSEPENDANAARTRCNGRPCSVRILTRSFPNSEGTAIDGGHNCVCGDGSRSSTTIGSGAVVRRQLKASIQELSAIVCSGVDAGAGMPSSPCAERRDARAARGQREGGTAAAAHSVSSARPRAAQGRRTAATARSVSEQDRRESARPARCGDKADQLCRKPDSRPRSVFKLEVERRIHLPTLLTLMSATQMAVQPDRG